MKVHVVGSGGREHALRYVLGRTSTIVDSTDEADLVVIGPEIPLVDGLADRLRAQGKLVYGPGAEGAQLEGSKSFMKDFVHRAGVPTARYKTCNSADEAVAFLKTLAPPYVVKTVGLASGKGVLVTEDFDEAVADVNDKLSGKSFGDSGRSVVIEEGMTGPELSLLYVFDGHDGVALPFAQDFKRVFDNNLGPNTGGMGVYSPVPIVSADMAEQVMSKIIEPTCAQLKADGIDYRGTLYAGIMVTADGPKLIEYNVRFGDPETQVVMPRLTCDLTELLASAAAGKIAVPSRIEGADAAVSVAICSQNYPGAPRTGDVITGIESAEQVPGVVVFHAGTSVDADGTVRSAGGRVLNVTALGSTIALARERAYEAVKHIHFDGMHFRSDIALEAASQ
jgi:phosphoribosylamine---glycine ligase